jgi:predicted ATPase
MFFTVFPVGRRAPEKATSCAFLLADAWNDWFKFRTQYYLLVFDAEGNKHDVGATKIGQVGLGLDNEGRPLIPPNFDELGPNFFSLGQDDSFYNELKALGETLRVRILRALRDVAFDETIFSQVLSEEITTESLLRSITPATVRGQFRRMALDGGARLTPYSFVYRAPRTKADDSTALDLSFDVLPDSVPPTNVQVLTGPNGVGKTYLLRRMAKSLVEPAATRRTAGEFVGRQVSFLDGIEDAPPPFANVVAVTFSAFDQHDDIGTRSDRDNGIAYTCIGLQRPKTKEGKRQFPKSPAVLASEFVDSLKVCLVGPLRRRWYRALDLLNTDGIFHDVDIRRLTGADIDKDTADWTRDVKQLFDQLSSGHKIVLLTLTKLVEKVEEQTLVLLDEPESHLHPPLLSTFVRALSNLLVDRNGVAIIATHSPVVLQEVPSSCVWNLRRSGGVTVGERPECQTFGENLGTLTRAVFGLEVRETGFHKMLSDAVGTGGDYNEICARFGDQLGAEARALIRAMVAVRDSKQD